MIASDNEEIAGDSDGERGDVVLQLPPAVRAGRRRGRRRCSEGKPRIFLVVASTGGFNHEHKRDFWRLAGTAGFPRFEEQCLVGVALALSWELVACSPGANDPAHALLRELARKKVRAEVPISGFVEYPIVDCAALHELVAVQNESASTLVATVGDYLADRRVPGGGNAQALSMSQVVSMYKDVGAPPPAVVVKLTPAQAILVVRGLLPIVHAVAVTKRLARSRLLISREPSEWKCKQFISEHGGGQQLTARAALPGQHPASVVIDWLHATRDIKSLKISRGPHRATLTSSHEGPDSLQKHYWPMLTMCAMKRFAWRGFASMPWACLSTARGCLLCQRIHGQHSTSSLTPPRNGEGWSCSQLRAILCGAQGKLSVV